MEGSLTGVSRLSNQLASMFFISEDIRPIYPRRYKEGCVRTGVRRQVCPLPHQPSSLEGTDTAAPAVHPSAASPQANLRAWEPQPVCKLSVPR